MTKRIACVTGSASGLGFATAKKLAQTGFSVAMLDSDTDKLKTAADQLKQAVPKADIIECPTDVADESAVIAALSQTKTTFGTPTVVVNCAGIIRAQRTVGKKGPMPLAEFEHIIRVNLTGTFNMIRLAVEEMQHLPTGESGERAVIINTSSIAAFEGQVGQAAYSASKAGVAGLTLCLAREFSTLGIRVVTIAPGPMDTPMLTNGLSENAQKSLREENTLFPKRFGKPEEFSALVMHIIENPLLNGAIIRLDGGVRLAAHV